MMPIRQVGKSFSLPNDSITSCCRYREKSSKRSLYGSTTISFLPRPSPLSARKHWIAYTLKPLGALIVDDGASRALRQGGRSLLPAGVRAVEGEFDVGDAVRVVDGEGREIARGLASYGARELERIRGVASSEIERVLGYRNDDEAIHRDDLVLLPT